jgi:hypothetical protein
MALLKNFILYFRLDFEIRGATNSVGIKEATFARFFLPEAADDWPLLPFSTNS